jgi:hypothetical protein
MTTTNITDLDAPDALAAFGIVDLTPHHGQKKDDDKPTCDPLADDAGRIVTKEDQRRLVELRKGQAAADRIGSLPAPGETVHLLMDATFDGIDLLPAMLDLMAPATVETLHISTLSFNRRVMDRLLALIDGGKVGRCVFCCSALFQGKERHLVDELAAELQARGGRMTVERNHTKLMLLKTTDGRHLVAEGSQNLRRCHCYEQLVISDHADLYGFYRKFIEGVMSNG